MKRFETSCPALILLEIEDSDTETLDILLQHALVDVWVNISNEAMDGQIGAFE